MIRISLLLGVCLLFVALGSCKPSEEYEACVERGIRYYKEIGSFPRLSTGEKAEHAAKKRCRRSKHAF